MNSVQYKTAGISLLILGCCAETLINNSITATLGMIMIVAGFVALIYSGVMDEEKEKEKIRESRRSIPKYNSSQFKHSGKATIQLLDEKGNVIASEQVEDVKRLKRRF